MIDRLNNDGYLFVREKRAPLLLILVISFIFISTGSFGLLNIFNIRRETQFIFIFLLVLYFPLLMIHWETISKKPLLLLTIVIFIFEFIFGKDFIIALDSLVSFIAVGILYSITLDNSQKVLKGIILVCGFFSFLAIIQALILIFKPGLIDSIINAGYSSSTRSAAVHLKHPLAYLGFGYHKISLATKTFVRLTSFAAEPSVLIYSFLTPGILALTFKGWVKKLGYIILFFVIILSFSGTVYLIIGLSIAVYFLFKLIRNNTLRVLLPFLIILFFTLILMFFDVKLIAGKFVDLLSGLSTKYSILSKQESAFDRLKGMSEYYKKIPEYPFGYIRTNVPMSILLNTYFLTGIFGTPLMYLTLKYIFKLCSWLYNNRSFKLKVVSCLLYSLFIVVIFFSDYGWRSTAGYIILVLTILRLEYLLNKMRLPDN